MARRGGQGRAEQVGVKQGGVEKDRGTGTGVAGGARLRVAVSAKAGGGRTGRPDGSTWRAGGAGMSAQIKRFFGGGADVKKAPRREPFQTSHFREELERARRFERPTLTLARLCSTPELRPLPWVRWDLGRHGPGCKWKMRQPVIFLPAPRGGSDKAAEGAGPGPVPVGPGQNSARLILATPAAATAKKVSSMPVLRAPNLVRFPAIERA